MNIVVKPVIAALVLIAAIIVAITAITACSTAPAVTTGTMPAYATGHGTDGSTSVLRIRQDGGTFTGTYDNTPAGQQGIAMQYTITGTITGDTFTSTWTFGGFVLTVTGRYTSQAITLDNPGGSFSTTTFQASQP